MLDDNGGWERFGHRAKEKGKEGRRGRKEGGGGKKKERSTNSQLPLSGAPYDDSAFVERVEIRRRTLEGGGGGEGLRRSATQ